MAYTKTTWVNGQTRLNDDNLNKIEQGILDAHALSGITYIDYVTDGETLTPVGGMTVAKECSGNITLEGGDTNGGMLIMTTWNSITLNSTDGMNWGESSGDVYTVTSAEGELVSIVMTWHEDYWQINSVYPDDTGRTEYYTYTATNTGIETLVPQARNNIFNNLWGSGSFNLDSTTAVEGDRIIFLAYIENGGPVEINSDIQFYPYGSDVITLEATDPSGWMSATFIYMNTVWWAEAVVGGIVYDTNLGPPVDDAPTIDMNLFAKSVVAFMPDYIPYVAVGGALAFAPPSLSVRYSRVSLAPTSFYEVMILSGEGQAKLIMNGSEYLNLIPLGISDQVSDVGYNNASGNLILRDLNYTWSYDRQSNTFTQFATDLSLSSSTTFFVEADNGRLYIYDFDYGVPPTRINITGDGYDTPMDGTGGCNSFGVNPNNHVLKSSYDTSTLYHSSDEGATWDITRVASDYGMSPTSYFTSVRWLQPIGKWCVFGNEQSATRRAFFMLLNNDMSLDATYGIHYFPIDSTAQSNYMVGEGNIVVGTEGHKCYAANYSLPPSQAYGEWKPSMTSTWEQVSPYWGNSMAGYSQFRKRFYWVNGSVIKWSGVIV